jgi:uncharacterized protein (DUF433 family)
VPEPEILEDYPFLDPEDIRANPELAAEGVRCWWLVECA